MACLSSAQTSCQYLLSSTCPLRSIQCSAGHGNGPRNVIPLSVRYVRSNVLSARAMAHETLCHNTFPKSHITTRCCSFREHRSPIIKNRDQQMPISACNGDSIENRTRVTAVKGRCLNRLTMEPHMIEIAELAASYFPGQSPAKYHRR